MITKIVATVERYNHNRRLVSVRMSEAEPHIMLHVGLSGDDHYAEAIHDLFEELMMLGHPFTVVTEYREVSALEFL